MEPQHQGAVAVPPPPLPTGERYRERIGGAQTQKAAPYVTVRLSLGQWGWVESNYRPHAYQECPQLRSVGQLSRPRRLSRAL